MNPCPAFLIIPDDYYGYVVFIPPPRTSHSGWTLAPREARIARRRELAFFVERLRTTHAARKHSPSQPSTSRTRTQHTNNTPVRPSVRRYGVRSSAVSPFVCSGCHGKIS